MNKFFPFIYEKNKKETFEYLYIDICDPQIQEKIKEKIKEEEKENIYIIQL